MVTIAQVQAGSVKFLDAELLPAFNGWQKVLVGAGAGLIVKNLPNTMGMLAANPVVAALGVWDGTRGLVDIDALGTAVLPMMGADALPVPIPGGVTVRLGRADIEKLIRYIKEA